MVSGSKRRGVRMFGWGEKRRLREKLEQKDRRIDKLRSRIASKDQKIQALQAGAGRRSADTPVFFLTGRAKSGTSWLMRILDSHPDILCKGEGRFFGREFKNEKMLTTPSKTIQPSSLYRAILDADYVNAWIERSVWSRDDDTQAHLDGLTRAAIEYFLTERLAKTGKSLVGDKTPLTSETVIREISTIFPEAKVIHILRDGRDVAVSSVHHAWNHTIQQGGINEISDEGLDRRDRYRADPEAFLASGESIFAGNQLAHIATSWARRVSRAVEDGPALLKENYAEVRYEDLLKDPEVEVGRLLRFLGTDAGEETTRRCVESASFESWTKGRERGQEDPTSFLRKGVAGDWKNVFTEEDRRVFEEAAGRLLADLGYEDGDGR